MPPERKGRIISKISFVIASFLVIFLGVFAALMGGFCDDPAFTQAQCSQSAWEFFLIGTGIILLPSIAIFLLNKKNKYNLSRLIFFSSYIVAPLLLLGYMIYLG